jgi:protein-L-isoaspartate(D-aspartate) O-methyltransferase
MGATLALAALALAGLAGLAVAGAATAGDRDADREAMLEAVAGDAERTAFETGRDGFAPRVMEALGAVPRHAFVPERLAGRAYENRPLPIGHGQTISQPYIVALMTDLLEPEAGDRVLEVGTGSGYQAAVLAELVSEVHSIEIVEPLAETARERLGELGYDNVQVYHGDGYRGLPDEAPFDGIIVTAAAPEIPPPLIAQLAPGGRLVIPVGPEFSIQSLVLMEKDEAGEVREHELLPVRFVPLTREDP